MQLSTRRRHQDDRGIVHSRKGFGGVSEENSDDRAGEMLMGRRDDTVTPQITNALCQGRDDPLEQALRAQLNFTTLEGLLEGMRIERFHGGDAFLEAGWLFRRTDRSPRGVARPQTGFRDKLAQLL